MSGSHTRQGKLTGSDVKVWSGSLKMFQQNNWKQAWICTTGGVSFRGSNNKCGGFLPCWPLKCCRCSPPARQCPQGWLPLKPRQKRLRTTTVSPNRRQRACRLLQPRDSVWSISPDNIVCLHRYLPAAINNCPPHTHHLISGFSLFKTNQENRSSDLHTIKKPQIKTQE